MLARESNVLVHKPNVLAREPNVLARKPNVLAREPNVPARKPNVLAREPNMLAHKPNVSACEPNVLARKTNVLARQPNDGAYRSGVLPAAEPKQSAKRHFSRRARAMFALRGGAGSAAGGTPLPYAPAGRKVFEKEFDANLRFLRNEKLSDGSSSKNPPWNERTP